MIIGFTGPAGSGKDTCADYLVAHHAFRKLSWASPLKAGLAAMGFPEPANRDDKERVIPGFDFTWREAAQKLGTEWGRALDPDIWVKAVGQQMVLAPVRTDFVISDVRFENEATMIRNMGGVIVHLHGRSADLGGAESHASEQGVASHSGDYLTYNVGTIEGLYETLQKTLQHARRVHLGTV